MSAAATEQMGQSATTGMEAVVSARGLTRRYGAVAAVDELDLDVPRGIILGLLGDNGAGKTTTIRMMLGLTRPTSGTLSVLGADPASDGPRVRERIGYVPEDRQLYPQMRVSRIVRYARSFHPGWDAEVEADLMSRFELDPKSRIRTLSRGALAKLHLLLALSPRPELLILDEATGGIDALARREILGNLVDLVADAGMTVIFASHVLADVERIADRVAILHAGRLLCDRDTDDLKESFAKLRVRFSGTAPTPPAPGTAGIRLAERRRSEWLLVTDQAAATRELVAGLDEPVELMPIPLSLEDIFVEILRGEGKS